MKITRQIGILIALPLLVQLATAGCLLITFAGLEEQASKEITAKKVVSTTDEINGLLGRYIMSATRERAMDSDVRAPEKKYGEQLMSKVEELNQLTTDNLKAHAILGKYDDDLRRFLANWPEQVRALDADKSKSEVSQVANERDRRGLTTTHIDQLLAESESLRRIYAPAAKLFRPYALRERAELRQIIGVIIFLNVLAVAALALAINKTVLSRIKVLMTNVDAFSRGDSVPEPIVGSDELSEMDSAFRKIAEERNRLDEIRTTTRTIVNQDIASPLTSMSQRLGSMCEKYENSLDAEITEQLRDLHSESRRLERSVSMMMDVEKIEDGLVEMKLADTSYAAIVQPAIDSLLTEADNSQIRIVDARGDTTYGGSGGAVDVSENSFPLDRYRPSRLLGAGGAGTVHLCFDENLRRDVAVKVLLKSSPDSVQSFQREAKITARFKHSNVVGILDFGVTGGEYPYMVLEHINGISLERLMKERGLPSAAESLSVFIQVADALAHAHSAGVFHRDLKCSNVLISKFEVGNPIVHLIDFGVSLMHEGGKQSTDIQGKTLVGTPRYMSPDQILGNAFDARSEIYSFGCLMYETMTGEPPYSSGDTLSLLTQHTNEPVPDFSNVRRDMTELPANLKEIVIRCLAKDPAERFQDMASLKSELEKLQHDVTESIPQWTRSPDLMVRCDKDRIIQVLINLLANAIKFSPARSEIEIRGTIKDRFARIEVVDSGPGVPEEAVGRLFLKFSQIEQSADTRNLGTGLGLYISKLLVEAHGGQIGYSARTPTGSRFWFELPLSS